jgi:phosphate starvation-inducible PhoH-like protein
MSSKKLRFSDNGHVTSNGNGRIQDSLFDKKLSKGPKLFAGPRAKTDGQQHYMEDIEDNDIIFACGPAGSGKTHLAVGMAVQALKDESVKKIVAVRPCLGVGRTLGYLPGDIEAKVAPYLRPIFDELRKFFTAEEIERLQRADLLEMGSLEHIRGRTFEDCFIIMDEAQNCTRDELKVFLTRLGMGSKYVINGDISRGWDGKYTQCDLPTSEQGYFEERCNRYEEGTINGIAVVKLTKLDIVRHPLVQAMIEDGL